ncbi:Hypothetical predicted protein, partial [Pelobates cultripes]
MINSAVAASMEKAIAKLWAHNSGEDPDTKDLERSTGDLVSSKRHWKGSGPAPRKSKGKAPLKRSRQAERQDPSTLPLSSSDEEEHNPPPALEFMDEWK